MNRRLSAASFAGNWTGPTMAATWRDCLLEELAAPTKNALVGGPFGSDLVSADYSSTGVPVIRGENLSAGRWVAGDFVFVSPAKAARLSANTAGALDIVFTQRGANHYRQVALVAADAGRRFLISQSQMKLTVDRDKADPLFLYYHLRCPHQQEYLRRNAIQTGVPHTNLSILRKLPVRIPSLVTQRAIAHALGSLDDKIELNQRMSETLEAMARALFKSWFVDFDPVRARAEGRDPGLPKPLADLFPARLVDSELGEIPEGWETGRIEDLADVSSGKRPDVRFRESSEFASVPLWGGNGPMAFVPVALIDHPIILTGRVGTLGSVFRITGPCWPSDNTLVLRAKRPWTFAYLFHQLKAIDFTALNRGSTQPLVTQTDLKTQPLLCPDADVLKHFHALTERLYGRVDESDRESRTLATLRDTLLPKLISGELRVKDPERFIAKAGNLTPGQSAA